jgi:ATP-binding cassette subfamily C (CFTR/MRP) protein 1
LWSTLWFALVLPVVVTFYYFAQKFYRNASRELKRLDSVSKSPIYSQFSETLAGTVYVRVYRAETRFIASLSQRIDKNLRAYYANLATNRWLGVRLEFLGNIAIVFTAIIALFQRQHLSPALFGLALAYVMNVTEWLNNIVRQISDVENRMNNAERVLFYVNQPREAEPVNPNYRPPTTWPEKGQIEFQEIVMHYRPDLPPALNSISCTIRENEKVGIVGRTGSGKSSLIGALFRLVELSEGTILIDGWDISRMGLDDLRSRIAIIPQDPILFRGSIRFNVDPAGLYEDAEVWRLLERVHLKEQVEALPEGLDSLIIENGDNFSLGQRQLFCIARALLKKAKILVLDEATAGVDMKTDALIQETIRKEFKQSTVLTVAHRISSIIDYDRVMVLSAGKLAEFDSPTALLNDPTSAFAQIVAQMHIDSPTEGAEEESASISSA